ncbi:MAG: carbohydrate ABC transporter permease, partial [Acidimicrobiales bacterium]
NTDSRGRSNQFAGLENYETIFGSDSNWDLSQWTDMFTRAPFELGLLLALVGFALAIFIGRRSGHSYGGSGILTPLFGLIAVAAAFFQLRLIGDDGPESAQGELVEAASTPLWRYAYVLVFLIGGVGLLYAAVSNVGFGGSSSSSGSGSSKIHKFPIDFGGGHGGMLAFGLFLIVTGVFATLRGTVLNSIWWVFAVTVLSTVFGLGIAALADRAKLENVAKSIIFMPLAISFVGAGIIWRFMYIARPQGQPQTGILNYLWLKLGDLSGSGARWIGVLVLLAIVLGAFAVAYTGYLKKARGLIGVGVAMSIPFLWLAWRLAQGRLGGTGEVTLDRTIFFLSQDLPYNNLWLMVVLIWIQTGFAMVIFSAAIKAVPSEFIEAARVDGATESSIFWRIIVPQIIPTIGVVVTTLIVTVLKVFDIVKVMTNGNFGSQIVANEMFFQAFTVGNQGVGSALAVILFVAVLPIVVINIRRLQAEEA